MGLHENLIKEITWADDDWTFILKIDALLETAAKEVIRRSLRLPGKGAKTDKDEFSENLDSLPINGRGSIIRLLEAAQCPADECSFIESVRRLRNSFAHDIRLVDRSLIEVIKQHPDKSRLIQTLSSAEKYSEEMLIRVYETDGHELRFSIVEATMRFLTIAYQISSK